MRPLVRTAMSSTASASRQKRKASEKDEHPHPNTPENSKETNSSRNPDPKSQAKGAKSTEPAAELKDFDRLVSSAPKRLNDIVQAPPQLSVGSRLKSKSKESSKYSGDKSDNVVSSAQKRMMDLEREKAIARYRALKSAKHEAS